MMKFRLIENVIEVIEVTGPFVFSLPNAGAILQRFGEQVEIMHPGPAHRKTYAQIGEYIAKFKDKNDKEDYVVISSAAFKGLFTEAEDQPTDTLLTEAEPEAERSSEQQPEDSKTAIADGIQLSPDTELTAAEKKRIAKERRLQELSGIDSLEAPLGEHPVKE